jgi:PhnB protein
MLAEEMPEHGSKAPGKDDERTSAVWLYVEDVDAVFKRAVEAGGRAKQEPTDAFWGDRWAMVFDPSGQLWHIATHTEDVSEEEIDRRAQAFAHQSVSQQQTSNV